MQTTTKREQMNPDMPGHPDVPGMVDSETVLDILHHRNRETKAKAAKFIGQAIGAKPTVSENTILWYYIKSLLETGDYLTAGAVMWPKEMFVSYNVFTRRVFAALAEKNYLYVQGAGSVGKSWLVAAYFTLDYARDAHWTSIRCVSTSARHARQNIFSHMVRFFKHAIVPLPGEARADRLGLEDESSGIILAAIPQGEDGRGRLRGFHQLPRPTPHPVFGNRSRIRVCVDEAEEVPDGIWEDLGNFMLNFKGPESAKLVLCYNPRRRTSQVGKRATPMHRDGWDSLNIDHSKEWAARGGAYVVRLDAHESENIKEGREVIPQMMTMEGLQALEKEHGGQTAPGYLTMGRGWFPEEDGHQVLVTSDEMTRAQGSWVWAQSPMIFAGVDPALVGDRPAVALVKAGPVLGMRRPNSMEVDRVHYGDVCYEIFLVGGAKRDRDVHTVCRDLDGIIESHGVRGENLEIDESSMGSGFVSWFREKYGPTVNATMFNQKVQKGSKLFPDQSRDNSLMFANMASLLYWRFRGLLQRGKLLINCDSKEWGNQFYERKWTTTIGESFIIEKKDDFKRRLRHSPDEADAIVLALNAAARGNAPNAPLTEKQLSEILPLQPALTLDMP